MMQNFLGTKYAISNCATRGSKISPKKVSGVTFSLKKLTVIVKHDLFYSRHGDNFKRSFNVVEVVRVFSIQTYSKVR